MEGEQVKEETGGVGGTGEEGEQVKEETGGGGETSEVGETCEGGATDEGRDTGIKCTNFV